MPRQQAGTKGEEGIYRVKRLSRGNNETSRSSWSTLQASRVMPTYQTVVSWTYWSLFLVSSPGLRAYLVSSCFKISFTIVYYLHFIPGLIEICSFCYLGLLGVVICKSAREIVKYLFIVPEFPDSW